MRVIIVLLLFSVGLASGRAEIVYSDPIKTNAMFIACDALLSGNFRELSIVTCNHEMSSDITQNAITAGKALCFPHKVTAQMRAYVFVRYVDRTYWKLPQHQRQAFLDTPWTEIARKAYEDAWRCS